MKSFFIIIIILLILNHIYIIYLLRLFNEVLKKNEESLGELFTFFMMETILLGKMMKLNPFDQPSVELIKRETKKLIS